VEKPPKKPRKSRLKSRPKSRVKAGNFLRGYGSGGGSASGSSAQRPEQGALARRRRRSSSCAGSTRSAAATTNVVDFGVSTRLCWQRCGAHFRRFQKCLKLLILGGGGAFSVKPRATPLGAPSVRSPTMDPPPSSQSTGRNRSSSSSAPSGDSGDVAVTFFRPLHDSFSERFMKRGTDTNFSNFVTPPSSLQ